MGFDWTPALLSVLLIAATRSVNLSFLIYTGSDLLAFAFFPYMAVVVLTTRNSYLSALICVPLMVLGFFLKNSLAIYTAVWIAGVLATNVVICGFSRRPRNSGTQPVGRGRVDGVDSILLRFTGMDSSILQAITICEPLAILAPMRHDRSGRYLPR